MNGKLFDDEGFPLYQPGIHVELFYRHSISRLSRTGWTLNGVSVNRKKAAKVLGVAEKDLLQWETAIDIESEEEARADYGEW